LALTSINNKTLKQEKEEAPSSLDKVRMKKEGKNVQQFIF
jgi:hypothetical protein